MVFAVEKQYMIFASSQAIENKIKKDVILTKSI